jgi:hypothetical protein
MSWNLVYASCSDSSGIKREDGMRRHVEKWTLVCATRTFRIITINMDLITVLITITVHNEFGRMCPILLEYIYIHITLPRKP